MEGIHERFFVSITGKGNTRDFEVVPSIGHYAILENDETMAEIIIEDSGFEVKNVKLPKDVLNSLLKKIQEHNT